MQRKHYRYTLLLTPNPGEDMLTVTVPALPGCVTQGKTPEQALERAREAIELHLEGLLLRGEPIPDETEHPQLLDIEVTAPERSVA
jgi:predicted RNase H-like HicB family nuclease